MYIYGSGKQSVCQVKINIFVKVYLLLLKLDFEADFWIWFVYEFLLNTNIVVCKNRVGFMSPIVHNK